MKMEAVYAELKNWGEILIVTSGGQHFEIHLGDTKWDFENRVIHLKTAKSLFLIDGDSVESIETHYGHPSE